VLSLIILSFLLQADNQVRCSPPGVVRNCHADDGSVYVEIASGNRLTRQWSNSDGETWTELIDYNSAGARLSGYDWRGVTWYQNCRPGYGTSGTDRTGAAIAIPPRRTKTGYEPCFNYTPRR
jgi:hypothetical protein